MPHDAIRNSQQRVSAAYALALFILGAVTGLLAMLGRLAQEIQAALWNQLPLPGLPESAAPRDVLPPLLTDLTDPVTRLIAAGCAISIVALLAGAGLWRATGHPFNQRERVWTRFATAIAVLVWIAIGAAGLVRTPGVRIGVVASAGSIALVGLVALVYLLVEFQFLDSAPSLPDEPPE